MNQIITDNKSVSDNSTSNNIPFSQFLEAFKEKMNQVFHVRGDIDNLSLKRGLPPFVMREIMSVNPLSVGIPVEFGGRGGIMKENLGLLAAASYESLALSLTFGINSALFLQPFGKFAQEEIKAPVFKRFLNDQTMGGLMITEPDYGSDALNMQTYYTESEKHFQLKGKKHWAGLTSWADYWLLSARQKSNSGKLQRDIDFFLCDVNAPDQNIEVEELFENLGLYAIPYGRNKIDVKLPTSYRLQPQTTGIKMMLDLLHRSRMQFPGMGMGFIKRMLDEGTKHCKDRFVGGKSLFQYDRVQHRLSKLQTSYTICSAMCVNSSENAGLEIDMAPHGMEANAVKSVVTDLMQEAAQSVVQLVGAKAYKINHIAGRGTIDSRPFQIFEGSNDILYVQITEALLKLMKKTKETNLFEFLKGFVLTGQAAERVKSNLNFNLDFQMSQRKLVEMGKIVGRLISMNQVLKMADKGFRKDLIENSIIAIHQEITKLVANYSFENKNKSVQDYEDDSSWLDFATT